MTQLALAMDRWRPAAGNRDAQRIARELADAHYPRKVRKAKSSKQVAPPGRRWVLVSTVLGRALWVVCQNRDPRGTERFRCTLFRNESACRSSELIAEATQLTYERWRRRGWLASAPPLRTEIDPLEVRRKRDPGRCFRKAGWRRVGKTDGAKKGRRDLLIFEAPPP